jgi:DNA-binding PadR family transcriptional regulator
MGTQLADIIETGMDDWTRVREPDLYELLDKLTAMQVALISLWDPDATIHPLTETKRHQVRDALHTAIVDLRKWIEQGHLARERQ